MSVSPCGSLNRRQVLALLPAVTLVLAISLAACAQAQKAPEPVQGRMAVRFFDVGQGDSCLVSLPDGKTMLIDAGPGSAENDLVKAISDLDVKRLDYVIFTHPHEDHIGGGPAALKAFDVGQVFMPRSGYTTVAYENLLEAIDAKGLKVTEAKAGLSIFNLPDMELRANFIGPGKSYEEINDISAVVGLRYGDRTFLFAGDAGEEAETSMTLSSSVQLPKADVLKVGHHGSATSTSAAFLEIVSPSVAVISVGAGNDYGHPAQSTLDRLTRAKATVYRTDVDGTIVISTDGSKMDVSTSKKSVK